MNNRPVLSKTEWIGTINHLLQDYYESTKNYEQRTKNNEPNSCKTNPISNTDRRDSSDESRKRCQFYPKLLPTLLYFYPEIPKKTRTFPNFLCKTNPISPPPSEIHFTLQERSLHAVRVAGKNAKQTQFQNLTQWVTGHERRVTIKYAKQTQFERKRP